MEVFWKIYGDSIVICGTFFLIVVLDKICIHLESKGH